MSETARSPLPGASRALIPFTPAPRATRLGLTLQHGLWAAGLVLAFGVGAAGVRTIQIALASPDRATVQAEANVRMLSQLQGEIGRLKGSVDTLRTAADGSRQDESLRTIRKSVETLKSEIDQVRVADGATLAQISTKIDKTDHDPSQKLADIVARLDRIEHEPAPKAADPNAPRVADLTSRLDRLEKQIASPAPTGSLPAAAHAAAAPPATTSVPRSTASRADAVPAVLAEARPAKAPTLDAYIVRDVYDGMALVQARDGGLREVGPGEFLPGAGQVRSIERHGREWVVLTSKGIIQASAY